MISQPNRDKAEQKISIVPVPRVLVQNCESDKNENYNSSLHILEGRELTICLYLLAKLVSIQVSLSHDVEGIVGNDRSCVDWCWIVHDGKFLVFLTGL